MATPADAADIRLPSRRAAWLTCAQVSAVLQRHPPVVNHEARHPDLGVLRGPHQPCHL